MEARFSIEVESRLSLVRLTFVGLFMPQAIRQFVEERDRAHRQLRCAPNQHVTLVDMRQMAIQPQESVAEFQRAMASPIARSRLLAFVTSKSLARKQIERAASGRNAAFFTDIDEARAWLLAAPSQAA